MAYTAIYDACVLYPAPIRDILMELAMADCCRAKWTDEIHREWIESLLKQRTDLKREVLEHTRDQMNRHAGDCLVTGYEFLIESLKLPDPGDRHVLAAAIHGRADVIVTFNLKDFPDEALAPHCIEAQHPDEYIMHLGSLAPEAVTYAAKRCRARLKHPPKTPEEYVAFLEVLGLPETVAFLRRSIGLI